MQEPGGEKEMSTESHSPQLNGAGPLSILPLSQAPCPRHVAAWLSWLTMLTL